MLRALLAIMVRDRREIAQDTASFLAMAAFLYAASLWLVGLSP